MNNINFKRRVVFTGLVFGLTALIVFNIKGILTILNTILSVLWPIILGGFMAFILNIIVDSAEKRFLSKTNSKLIKKLKRPISILMSLAFFIIIILLLSRIIIPQISRSLVLFADQFPGIYKKIINFLVGISKEFPSLQNKLLNSNIDAQAILKKLVSLSTTWGGGLLNIINSIFSVLANIVIALIIALYILVSKESLKSQFNRLFATCIPKPILDKFYYLARVTYETFKSFFIGQFIEAIILGVLCSVGLMIFGFPFAIMIGSVVGVTALIPMVGAYLGGLFGFLMVLSVNPVRAFAFIVFLIILQQIEGNLIYPKVVGSSIGLPGIWVFVAVIVSGGLFGITGVILGVPIIASLYKILKNYVNKREENLEEII